jgi:5-methylcytosine-specific restriction enzyme B
MARVNENDISQIIDAASDWRDRCLIAGKSLFWNDEDVWSLVNLERFKICFIDTPDEAADRTFEQKFKDQLANEDENVARLACELLFVYFLFPSLDSVGPSRKISLIREIARFKGLNIPEDDPRFDSFSDGIGNPGLVYNTGRPAELVYLGRFSIKIAEKPEDERRALLNDHLKTRALLGELADAHREEFGRPPQLRHIVLYLLFPDDYERIASEGHKARICEAFCEILEADRPEDDDDCLKAIRQKLEELLPGQDLDFYWEPLHACWYTSADTGPLSELEALDIKKQIVLYGPPGTGKTFQARDIANSLIRRQLLKHWGPRRFFSSSKQISEIVTARAERVQFHPGYGYEDFIRGLQIARGSQTEYRDGVLLRIVRQLETETAETPQLPFILILDEMNRADLSKVLGECFSLLEDRDTEVRLGGHDDETRKVHLPENLYMIGTMNLIDQSLEHVDFALRRRFLWFFKGFSRDDFLAVSHKRWNELLGTGRLSRKWERVEEEFETLADRALELNNLIGGNPYLGQQYEIGHTYFCDVVGFVHRYLASSATRRNRVLFNGRGSALTPIETLWRYSLQPLLTQYLSGIDSAERDALLSEAEQLLFSGDSA